MVYLHFAMLRLFTTILITPSKGWEEATGMASKRDVIIKYALPLVIISGLCAFCGELIRAGALVWQEGLGSFTLIAVTLFASFYITAVCVKWLYKWLIADEIPFTEALKFTIFSYSCAIFITMTSAIFEDVFIIYALHIMTFYIVYEGCGKYLKITTARSERRSVFILLTSLLIIFTPSLVGKVLVAAMPGLG